LRVVAVTSRRSGIGRTLSSLSSAGFALLLDRLADDRERSAEAYERLRRALVKYFDWRGAAQPETCADDTIDRLARKLEEGTTVEDVDSYARGIARIVLLEQQRLPAPASLDDHPGLAHPAPASADTDRRHACLDRCLDELPAESRVLVVDYYAGDRSEKIANRRRLASRLGLTDNALRSRVQRLRERLEACLHDCLAVKRD
jgi:DNA-directed RNA polymerase specialized sigma24 family protein